MELLVLGVKELDDLIGGGFHHPSMIVIAGHPGSGKTTLASTICASNAEKGHKCLYITFQEDREKLLDNMEKLGIKIKQLEQKGLIRVIDIPVTVSPSTIENLIDNLSRIIREESYRVVVIDSINTLLEIIEDKNRRAFLRNFLYNVPRIIKGLLVTIAELPLGAKSLSLGPIEFIADAIFVLKYRYRLGMLIRELEIRKVRESALSITKVPFTIADNEGLKILVPPRIERIQVATRDKLYFTCRMLADHLGSINKGEVMYITYPPDARIPHVMIPVLDLVLTNNLKLLFVSFRYSAEEAKNILLNLYSKLLNLTPKDTIDLLDKYFFLESLNPVGLDMIEITSHIKSLLGRGGAIGMLCLHGIEGLEEVQEPREYWAMLTNTLYYLKSQGLVTIIQGSITSKTSYNKYASLADIVAKIEYRFEEGDITPYLYIWRRGFKPVVNRLEEYFKHPCLTDLHTLALEKLGRVEESE